MAVNLSNLASMNAMEIAQAAQNVADAQGIGDEYRETSAEGHTTRESAQQSFDTKVAKKQAEQKRADNNKKKIIIGLAAAIAIVIAIVAFILVKRKK